MPQQQPRRGIPRPHATHSPSRAWCLTQAAHHARSLPTHSAIITASAHVDLQPTRPPRHARGEEHSEQHRASHPQQPRIEHLHARPLALVPCATFQRASLSRGGRQGSAPRASRLHVANVRPQFSQAGLDCLVVAAGGRGRLGLPANQAPPSDARRHRLVP